MLASIPQIGHVELASGSLSAIEQLQSGHSYLLVIDANLPAEEAVSLVRWSKQHRPDTRCVVLVKSMVELDQVRSAGADDVFLRSIRLCNWLRPYGRQIGNNSLPNEVLTSS